jgi:hypothetical protein
VIGDALQRWGDPLVQLEDTAEVLLGIRSYCRSCSSVTTCQDRNTEVIMKCGWFKVLKFFSKINFKVNEFMCMLGCVNHCPSITLVVRYD